MLNGHDHTKTEYKGCYSCETAIKLDMTESVHWGKLCKEHVFVKKKYIYLKLDGD